MFNHIFQVNDALETVPGFMFQYGMPATFETGIDSNDWDAFPAFGWYEEADNSTHTRDISNTEQLARIRINIQFYTRGAADAVPFKELIQAAMSGLGYRRQASNTFNEDVGGKQILARTIMVFSNIVPAY